jgi:hypothetical protein
MKDSRDFTAEPNSGHKAYEQWKVDRDVSPSKRLKVCDSWQDVDMLETIGDNILRATSSLSVIYVAKQFEQLSTKQLEDRLESTNSEISHYTTEEPPSENSWSEVVRSGSRKKGFSVVGKPSYPKGQHRPS